MPVRRFRTKQGRRFTNRMTRRGGRNRFRTRTSKINANKEMIKFMPMGSQVPVPQRYRCKFVTSVQFNMIVGAGGAASGIIPVKMNSIFHPWANSGLGANPYANFGPQAVGTLQPSGYASLINANLYKRWRVYSSAIELKFNPSAQADTLIVAVTPSDNPAIPTSSAQAQQQPYCKFRIQQSNQIGVVKNYITQHKLVGATKRAIEDDLSGNFQGNAGGDPADVLYWVINWSTVDTLANTTPIICEIKLTYYCELFGDFGAALLET